MLLSLNRARRGAYSDIDSVNISGGLVLLQLVENESEIEKTLAGVDVKS